MSITSEMDEYMRRAEERQNLEKMRNLPGQVFTYTSPPLIRQVMSALAPFNLKECHIEKQEDGSIKVQAVILDANADLTEE